MGLETFGKVYHIGIAIEDDLLKENKENSKSRWNKKSDNPNSLDVSTVQTQTPQIEALTQKPYRRQQLNYMPLRMTYDQAFECLKNKAILKPIGPTPDPPLEKWSSRWGASKYCKYHQVNDHSTEDCFRLKDLLQDMIEDGRLPIRPGAKKLNTKTNPLATLMIGAEEGMFDPTNLITPIGQLLEEVFSSNSEVLHASVNALWDSDGEDVCHNFFTSHNAVTGEDMLSPNKDEKMVPIATRLDQAFTMLDGLPSKISSMEFPIDQVYHLLNPL